MPKLHLKISEEIEEELEERMENTGLTKSEIVRNAIVERLKL